MKILNSSQIAVADFDARPAKLILAGGFVVMLSGTSGDLASVATAVAAQTDGYQLPGSITVSYSANTGFRN